MCGSEDGKQGGAMQRKFLTWPAMGLVVKRPFVLGG